MKNVLQFLTNLSQNNTREWFEANKNLYDEAKAETQQLVTAILAAMLAFEPEFAHLKANDCMFRIFRDVRFSKDKTPYKPYFSAYFQREGRKSMRAGYYLHIQPGGSSMLAGGMWMPEKEALKSIRQEIDYNAAKLHEIIDDQTFVKNFGSLFTQDMLFSMPRSLKKAPKEYAADHSEIELLKQKDFTLSHGLTDAQLTEPDFADYAVSTWKTLKPFNDFLNTAVDNG
ncbi:MAG: DUF2461 domain-containing protein [Verrucomicrobia bacterium]|nr:DUF2461 domain-containing protein [Cytophagales bacterium]